MEIVEDAKTNRPRIEEDVAADFGADGVDTSPMITEKDLKAILADIMLTTGADQFLVCVGIMCVLEICWYHVCVGIMYDTVYTHKFGSVK